VLKYCTLPYGALLCCFIAGGSQHGPRGFPGRGCSSRRPSLRSRYAAGSDQSPVTSHQSPVTSHKSQVTSHKAQVTSHNAQITGHRSQITGHRSQSPCHRNSDTVSASLSLCGTVPMCPCVSCTRPCFAAPAFLLLCLCLTVSLCHCVTVSLCHCATVSRCHCVTVRRWSRTSTPTAVSSWASSL